MRMKKTGFTLTELLIAIGVVGVLAAILLPIIFNIMPDQKIMMAKRSFYAAQVVISDMINDQNCYPDREIEGYEGFDDYFKYKDCKLWQSTSASPQTPSGGASSAFTKFSTIFSDALGRNTTTGKTSDGMIWDVISNTGSTYFADIVIDVNGIEKPNCGQSSLTGTVGGVASQCAANNRYDRYTLHLKTNGQLVIDNSDTWAINAVKVDADIQEKN